MLLCVLFSVDSTICLSFPLSHPYLPPISPPLCSHAYSMCKWGQGTDTAYRICLPLGCTGAVYMCFFSSTVLVWVRIASGITIVVIPVMYYTVLIRMCVRLWTGLSWLGIGSSDGLFWRRLKTFVFRKTRPIYWPDELVVWMWRLLDGICKLLDVEWIYLAQGRNCWH
jgi:hypothetical protein